MNQRTTAENVYVPYVRLLDLLCPTEIDFDWGRPRRA